ncbi:hypothetical protein J8G26_18980 [Acidovorax sp. JG5]|uniref:hypothetical protein n=1 Tax=Acidovorax sp. JG5 TaxID=2822718 RepID=UPI001B341D70|nr:hypothetical protein [Acidovorax sp. JG5]MBP3982746.1 hypothetical protein [Acidovorax sp. JG5]
MKIYRDHASLCYLARPTADMELRALVEKRLNELVAVDSPDLSTLLRIIVVNEGDTTNAVEDQLGFTILHNRWNGQAPEAKDFTPSWDVLEEHTHWYELTFVISDDGFGIVVFVPKSNCDALVALCDRYAKEMHVL